MKAMIIETREEIQILGMSYEHGTAQYIDSSGVLRVRTFNDKEIKILSTDNESSNNIIDWEQRRYEIAKEVLPALVHLKGVGNYGQPCEISKKQKVSIAIQYADELIKNLK